MVAALLTLPPLAVAVLLWRANRAMRASMRAAAEADPVTGLPGRPRFLADLDARLDDCGDATLLLARLDGFAAYDAAFDQRTGRRAGPDRRPRPRRRRACGGRRQAPWAQRARSRPCSPGRAAQRPRQARDPRRPARQGRRADRRGARLRPRPSGDRRAHPAARTR